MAAPGGGVRLFFLQRVRPGRGPGGPPVCFAGLAAAIRRFSVSISRGASAAWRPPRRRNRARSRSAGRDRTARTACRSRWVSTSALPGGAQRRRPGRSGVKLARRDASCSLPTCTPSAMRLDTPQRCVRPERRRPSMPVKAPRSLSRPRHGTAVYARFRPPSPVQPPGASYARPLRLPAWETRSSSLRSDCSFRWCHGSEKDGALALPHPALKHPTCQHRAPAPFRNLPRSARWPGQFDPGPGQESERYCSSSAPPSRPRKM